MKTILYRSTVYILIIFFGVSCATRMLWDATDPKDYGRVRDPSVTRAYLEEEEIDYQIDRETGALYVEKSRSRKARDYAVRTVVTPVTLAVDGLVLVGNVIIVVGAIAIAIPIAIVEFIREGSVEEEPEEPLETVEEEQVAYINASPSCF